ncbi:MAG: hypothetical protein F6K54_10275 [Okeania sp. SIO3B5]|uniref:glutamate-cysteine ligase family protein n=1 Tax=Okeania sp. SIO3B5 TaxID=2607811 RepID=UPI0014002CB5|nr:glutamate-cysteine ligase family protein [Okeania sp. SIO3B5]NEO53433.1 hypothetical protein [Okeania sp. SIO3B5]
MPTINREEAVSIETAKLIAKEKAFGISPSAKEDKKIGLELEIFPFLAQENGMAIQRLELQGKLGIIDILDNLSEKGSLVRKKEAHSKTFCRYPLQEGGFINFEGGGQIEISTSPFDSPAKVLKYTKTLQSLLAKTFAEHGVVLLGAGFDRWHRQDEIKLQVNTPRQAAFLEYFSRFDKCNLLLTKTGSIQINLDFGSQETWLERWLVANLICPIITATFACSPSADGVSTRARLWQKLEPTRVGFACCDGSEADNMEAWSEATLRAKVIVFKLPPDRVEPADVEISFTDWIENGHPVYGWPTVEDFIYHLSTCFFEVRPRGYIELRACDMLPGVLQPIPVTLVTTLLYEEVGRKKCLELLYDKIPSLEDLWKRSAVSGLRDQELARLAHETWKIAIESMDRLPKDYLGEDYIKQAINFLETYTFVNKMPADTLEMWESESIPKALKWSLIN